MTKIYEWSEIKSEFTDALLVGNGGSIALNIRFSFKSLYDEASKREILNEKAEGVFQKFYQNTGDFERVLYRLWQANFINEKFNVSEVEREKIKDAYNLVKNALIQTVKAVHPDHSEFENLYSIGNFLSKFSTVFSLNYDFIIYWAMMLYNDKNKNAIKDGFISCIFDKEKIENLREPYRPNPKATMLFYVHGNLALYQAGEDKKEKKIITSNGDSLIDTVTNLWNQGRGNPLFISEGTKEEKLESIRSSDYLSYVYHQELPFGGTSLVIYGWGMGKQDDHILEQIGRGSYRRLAISIYKGDRSPEVINDEIKGYKERILSIVKNIKEGDIKFFDAQSKGCWNNED